MKGLKKGLLIGLVVAAIIVIFILLPTSDDINKKIGEGEIQFTPEDTMNTLQFKIEKMKAEIAKNGDKFEVGINSLVQYSTEQLCRFRPDMKPKDASAHENKGPKPAPGAEGLPGSYPGFYTPAKDQGGDGASWAYAMVAELEGLIKKQTDSDVVLSEKYLVDCNTEGYTAKGGGVCFDMFMAPHGGVLEMDYPCPGGNCNNCKYTYKISDWGYVGSSSSVPSVEAIKNAIYTYGTVVAGVCADVYFQSYTGGCYTRNNKNTVNHSVVLYGWNDTTPCETGGWNLKNSWGLGWGIEGNMNIKYGVSSIGYAACFAVYP
ncbi:MAG: C1 family peptidase [Candidatus Omnitrophota bacterium]